MLAGRETAGNPQSGRESVFVVEVDSIEEPGVSPTESAIPQRSRPPRLLLRVFLLSSSTALYPSYPRLSLSLSSLPLDPRPSSSSSSNALSTSLSLSTEPELSSQGENPSVLLTS